MPYPILLCFLHNFVPNCCRRNSHNSTPARDTGGVEHYRCRILKIFTRLGNTPHCYRFTDKHNIWCMKQTQRNRKDKKKLQHEKYEPELRRCAQERGGNLIAHIGLTLILLTWRIWWASNNASRWDLNRCLTLSVPTSDLVRQYDFSSSAPMSEDVRHGFCCVRSPAVRTCPTRFLM
jgi:hypothetical protein